MGVMELRNNEGQKRILSKKERTKYYESLLPIHSDFCMQERYSDSCNKEEYLLEIYEKLDIHVLEKIDSYYYRVIMPKKISFARDDENGYWLKNSKKELLMHYYDKGRFYNRTVAVDQINVTL